LVDVATKIGKGLFLMWESLFIDLGALICLIAGIWMIYYKIKVAPGLKDIDPYFKGQLITFIPLGIILIILGALTLLRILPR